MIRDVGSHATTVEKPENEGLGGSQCVWRLYHEGYEFAFTVGSTQRNIPGKSSNPCMLRFYAILFINETGHYSPYTQVRELLSSHCDNKHVNYRFIIFIFTGSNQPILPFFHAPDKKTKTAII